MAPSSSLPAPGALVVNESRDDPERGLWGRCLGFHVSGNVIVECVGYVDHGQFRYWSDGGPHRYFAHPLDIRHLTPQERREIPGI